MKTVIKTIFLCGIIVLTTFGCEKEEVLPLNHAKGRIIQTFKMCYGDWIMIEVENPEGIGLPGTFAFPGNEESRITYKNAIGVPSFQRLPELNINNPETIGAWLYFEYRKLTDEERHSNIYVDTSYHGICNTMIGPPSVNMYMITKNIDYHINK